MLQFHVHIPNCPYRSRVLHLWNIALILVSPAHMLRHMNFQTVSTQCQSSYDLPKHAQLFLLLDMWGLARPLLEKQILVRATHFAVGAFIGLYIPEKLFACKTFVSWSFSHHNPIGTRKDRSGIVAVLAPAQFRAGLKTDAN